MQFISPYIARDNGIHTVDTIPNIRAIQRAPVRNTRALELIALFFIGAGLIFLAATMSVLFFKLFIAVWQLP